MKLRTLIVEDEPLSQFYLGSLLKQLPMVEVVAKAGTEEEAITAIHALKPDLIFLDIELHSGTGFGVLRRTEHLDFSVVFTTALEQHAIEIIKLSGVPFLQKPIEAEELTLIISKVQSTGEEAKTALTCLLHTLKNENKPHHIALRNERGIEHAELDHVLFIKEQGPAVFHLHNGLVKPDIRPLKEIESLLASFGFFRAAATHIVNIHKIKSVPADGDKIVMEDGSFVPLSAKKREALLSQLSRR
jgi:two-component system LytT family response regulator